MSSPTFLSDFLGANTLANRPASPNVPAGTAAFYYGTDTQILYLWTGAAWIAYSSQAGAAPTIIQNLAKDMTGAASVTLGAAPAQNNVLVFIWFGSNLPNPAAGWLSMNTNGLGFDFAGIFYKVCGAAESATQTPMSGNITAGTGIMYEIHTGTPGFFNMSHGTASTLADAITVPKNALVIGAFENAQATTLPTSITNGTLDNSATATSRSIQGFHASQSTGATTYTANYAASNTLLGAVLCIT